MTTNTTMLIMPVTTVMTIFSIAMTTPVAAIHILLGTISNEETPMIITVNAVTFRQTLGDMINQVQYRRDSIVITKDGNQVAALIDINLFRRYTDLLRSLDDIAGDVAELFSTIPADQGRERIAKLVGITSAPGTEE